MWDRDVPIVWDLTREDENQVEREENTNDALQLHIESCVNLAESTSEPTHFVFTTGHQMELVKQHSDLATSQAV